MVSVLMLCLLLVSLATAGDVKEFSVGEDSTTDHRGSGVKFTRPDGTPVFVNPRAVAFVRAPLDGELGNATIVFTSGAKQVVEETVDQVIHGIHLDMPIVPGGG